jgi:hypothetical protein
MNENVFINYQAYYFLNKNLFSKKKLLLPIKMKTEYRTPPLPEGAGLVSYKIKRPGWVADTSTSLSSEQNDKRSVAIGLNQGTERWYQNTHLLTSND